MTEEGHLSHWLFLHKATGKITDFCLLTKNAAHRFRCSYEQEPIPLEDANSFLLNETSNNSITKQYEETVLLKRFYE